MMSFLINKLSCYLILSFTTTMIMSCQTARTDPLVIPSITEPTQSSFFTATPDLNLFTISAEIVQENSQTEIAKILFSKWLNHFTSDNIDAEMRLDEYVINKINIPFNQGCAQKLGGVFIVEAEVAAKTTLPLHSLSSENTSRWMTSGGGVISESDSNITRLFNAVISRTGTIYTLLVITQIPMCL